MARILETMRHPVVIIGVLLALLPTGLARGRKPAAHPDRVIATLPGATPTPAETTTPSPTPGDTQVRAASSQTRAAGIGWHFYAGLLLAAFSIVLVLLVRDRYRNGGIL